jgi:hypothetical protein
MKISSFTAFIASCIVAGVLSGTNALVSPQVLSISPHSTSLSNPPEAFHHCVSSRSRRKPHYTHPHCYNGVVTTRLHEKRGDIDGINAAVDGSGRGLVLMALTLTACVWIFSIPPQYRRAHICATNVERSDCVPLGSWASDVQEYYRHGGGIHFDFTIDQSTRDYWSGGRK